MHYNVKWHILIILLSTEVLVYIITAYVILLILACITMHYNGDWHVLIILLSTGVLVYITMASGTSL